MTPFDVTFLGTSAALPAHGRFPTSQILRTERHLFMIDCGEGTQIRLSEYEVRWGKLRHIFISHLHGDHIFGLVGLLTSMALQSRVSPLHLHGPANLEPFLTHQLSYSGPLPFELHFHAVDPDQHQIIYENAQVEVYSLPLRHRVPASGFLFQEKPRPRNIRPEVIDRYGIHYRFLPGIQQGDDFVLPSGDSVPNVELTLPPRPPRSYAFCSDTAYHEALIPLLQGVDLLYHEATFLHADADRAEKTGHSTARQAATIAKAAGVGQLAIGHYSSRYIDLMPLLEEAQDVFPNTLLAMDGEKVNVKTPSSQE